ncbi:unnamed protein product [Heligmosomoides polygyrus]|uniref:G_PROTEIN_RECEP_F1_2 domain-containing protein n=1 Tax=Heligmosomoides polygyrus TaxID=6339 RepID=A0A183GS73_HELPZ|nr:unnamed protein product [Heligmosomoides polygyrus]
MMPQNLLLNILGLPMAQLCKSLQIPLTIALLKLLIDISIMSDFCNSYGLLCSLLRFFVVPPVIGYLTNRLGRLLPSFVDSRDCL